MALRGRAGGTASPACHRTRPRSLRKCNHSKTKQKKKKIKTKHILEPCVW